MKFALGIVVFALAVTGCASTEAVESSTAAVKAATVALDTNTRAIDALRLQVGSGGALASRQLSTLTANIDCGSLDQKACAVGWCNRAGYKDGLAISPRQVANAASPVPGANQWHIDQVTCSS